MEGGLVIASSEANKWLCTPRKQPFHKLSYMPIYLSIDRSVGGESQVSSNPNWQAQSGTGFVAHFVTWVPSSSPFPFPPPSPCLFVHPCEQLHCDWLGLCPSAPPHLWLDRIWLISAPHWQLENNHQPLLTNAPSFSQNLQIPKSPNGFIHSSGAWGWWGAREVFGHGQSRS